MPIFTRLQVAVQINEGTRVRFTHEPSTTMRLDDQRLCSKYLGREGVVAGFAEKFVGPLDSGGLLPGVYLSEAFLRVDFGANDVQQFAPACFNVVEGGVIVEPPGQPNIIDGSTSQRLRDLPHPIKYYQGDTVRYGCDAQGITRTVKEVVISDNGEPVYHLAPTSKEVEERRIAAQDRRQANPGLMFLGGDSVYIPEIRTTDATLTLVKGGNVRAVYTGGKPTFDASREALLFWSNSAFSTTLGGAQAHIGWTIPQIANGEFDFVICQARDGTLPPKGGLFDHQGRKCCCTPYRLRGHFETFRAEVRNSGLALAWKDPYVVSA
jgi:hypothetical protein